MTLGLFGWRRAERSNSASTLDVGEAGLLLAPNEDSMVDSCAVREMSICVCGENLLNMEYDVRIVIQVQREYIRFLATRTTLYAFTRNVLGFAQPGYVCGERS